MRVVNALTLAVGSALALTYGAPVKAQDDPLYSQSDYGGVGLLQMPSARMNDEGEFSLNYVDNDEFRRLSLSLQMFPWLEGVVRYTDIRYERYSRDDNFSNGQTLKDKGLDLKLRLWQESRYWPQLSVGLRDLAGTGIYSGEYLAASKQWGPFDLTLGLGFGYLGTRGNINNPFCQLADRFCQREGVTEGTGGDFEVDDWFSGPAAVFGGIEYQTPWPELSLTLEYDGNDYSAERFSAPFDPTLTEAPVYADSPWNIGAVYNLHNNLRLTLAYQRGNTVTFGVTLRTDFNGNEQLKVVPRKRPALHSPEQPAFADDIAAALQDEAGYQVEAMQRRDNRVTLYGSASSYRSRSEALERAGRVLASELPEYIQQYELVEVTDGMAVVSDNINAERFKRIIRGEQFSAPLQKSYSQSEGRPATASDWWLQPQTRYPSVSWGLSPELTQSFGGADGFYLYQLSAELDGRYRISPNWQVAGTLGINLINNYDKFSYTVDAYDTPLPRVRTYVREYYDDSDVWVQNLYSKYSAKLAQNWYGAVYAGYLERMFAGVGSSVLYRPLGSNWAFGADLNRVQQRSFNSRFGLRDYKVWTGHLSAYWQTPYLDDSLVEVSVGRFLAGDEGVYLNFEHKFDTGVVAGVYAAFTNVSAADYGEGSFTKGFYLSIPFDLFSITPSRNRAAIGWSPITRDGGQRLSRPVNLYGATDSRSRFYNEN